MRTKKTLLNELVRIMQTVLQHRITPKPVFLARCQSNLSAIQQSTQREGQLNDEKLHEIFENLVDHQLFSIRRRLVDGFKKLQSQNYMSINFLVSEKLTSKIILSETWLIKFEHEPPSGHPLAQETSDKQNQMKGLSFLYQQILKRLRSQPLFSDIIINQKVRTKFIIDYKLHFHQNALNHTILDAHQAWMHSARVDSMRLTLSCHYHSAKISLIDPPSEENSPWRSKSFLSSGQNQEKFSKRLSEQSTKSFKRMSFFDYYDDDLETTVLSQDRSSMGQPKSPVNTHLIEVEENQSDEQFQFLVETNEERKPDQVFLEENEKIFEDLNDLEDEYFNSDPKVQA